MIGTSNKQLLSSMNNIYVAVSSLIDSIDNKKDINIRDLEFISTFINDPQYDDNNLNLNDLHQLGSKLWNALQSSLRKDAMKDGYIMECCIVSIQLIDFGWLENGNPQMKALHLLQMINTLIFSFKESILQENLKSIALKCKGVLKSFILGDFLKQSIRVRKEISTAYMELLSSQIIEILDRKSFFEEFSVLLKSDSIPVEDWLNILGVTHNYCVDKMKNREKEIVIEIIEPLIPMLHSLQGIYFSEENEKLSKSCYSLGCILVSALTDCERIEDADYFLKQIEQKYWGYTAKDKFFSYLQLKIELISNYPEKIVDILVKKNYWSSISSIGWVDLMLYFENKWNGNNNLILENIWDILIENATKIEDWVEIINSYLQFCSYNSKDPKLSKILESVNLDELDDPMKIETTTIRFLQVSNFLFSSKKYQQAETWIQNTLKLCFINKENGLSNWKEILNDTYLQYIRIKLCIIDQSNQINFNEFKKLVDDLKIYTDPNSEEMLLVQFIIDCHERNLEGIENILELWKSGINVKGDTLIAAGKFALQFHNREAAINVLEISLLNSQLSSYESKSNVIRCLLSLYRTNNGEEKFLDNRFLNHFVNLVGYICDFPIIQSLKNEDTIWLCKSIWNGVVDLYQSQYYLECFNVLETLCTIAMWKEEIDELILLRLDSCKLKSRAALEMFEKRVGDNIQLYLNEALKSLSHGRSTDSKIVQLKQRNNNEFMAKIENSFASLFVTELQIRIALKDSMPNIRNFIKAACMHENVSIEHLSLMSSVIEESNSLDQSQAEELIKIIFKSSFDKKLESIDDYCSILISSLNISRSYTDTDFTLIENFLNLIPLDSSQLKKDQIEYICTKFFNNSAKAYRLNFILESDKWLKLAEVLTKSQILQTWNGTDEVMRLREILQTT